MLPIIKSKSLESNYDQTGASKRDVKKDVNEDGVSPRETNPNPFLSTFSAALAGVMGYSVPFTRRKESGPLRFRQITHWSWLHNWCKARDILRRDKQITGNKGCRWVSLIRQKSPVRGETSEPVCFCTNLLKPHADQSTKATPAKLLHRH